MEVAPRHKLLTLLTLLALFILFWLIAHLDDLWIYHWLYVVIIQHHSNREAGTVLLLSSYFLQTITVVVGFYWDVCSPLVRRYFSNFFTQRKITICYAFTPLIAEGIWPNHGSCRMRVIWSEWYQGVVPTEKSCEEVIEDVTQGRVPGFSIIPLFFMHEGTDR